MSCSQCQSNPPCPMPGKYGRPSFDPMNAIEGYTNSPVWIIGLNPYADKNAGSSNDNQMQWYPDQPSSKDWSSILHFKRLRTILGNYFFRLGQKDGIASTDIVKCASNSFDRWGVEGQAVQFCKDFLKQQMVLYKPKLIIVIGSAASRYIEELSGVTQEDVVKPVGDLSLSGHTLRYILSGYTGYQMDRYAKARLTHDVQTELQKVFG